MGWILMKKSILSTYWSIFENALIFTPWEKKERLKIGAAVIINYFIRRKGISFIFFILALLFLLTQLFVVSATHFTFKASLRWANIFQIDRFSALTLTVFPPRAFWWDRKRERERGKKIAFLFLFSHIKRNLSIFLFFLNTISLSRWIGQMYASFVHSSCSYSIFTFTFISQKNFPWKNGI